jgi:hypothetical protein
MKQGSITRSQKILAFWAAVIGLIVFKLTTGRTTAPHMDTKVIFLGPGCGHLSYSMGFTKAILDDPVLHDKLVETKAVFGGVSSGNNNVPVP